MEQFRNNTSRDWKRKIYYFLKDEILLNLFYNCFLIIIISFSFMLMMLIYWAEGHVPQRKTQKLSGYWARTKC